LTSLGVLLYSKREDMSHNVYVVRLHPDVLKSRKFRDENPNHDPRKPCVYVGITGLSPDERFDNHKAGYKSCRFVEKFGLNLMPSLYEKYNPMSYDKACEMEEKLAGYLHKKGYAVWQK
jgi:hypothetical protein